VHVGGNLSEQKGQQGRVQRREWHSLPPSERALLSAGLLGVVAAAAGVAALVLAPSTVAGLLFADKGEGAEVASFFFLISSASTR